MYGSWEATIYNNNYKASDKAKDKLRKMLLSNSILKQAKLNNI